VKELKDRLICALLHDASVCDSCRKCGDGGAQARINLVNELETLLKKEQPVKAEKTFSSNFYGLDTFHTKCSICNTEDTTPRTSKDSQWYCSHCGQLLCIEEE